MESKTSSILDSLLRNKHTLFVAKGKCQRVELEEVHVPPKCLCCRSPNLQTVDINLFYKFTEGSQNNLWHGRVPAKTKNRSVVSTVFFLWSAGIRNTCHYLLSDKIHKCLDRCWIVDRGAASQDDQDSGLLLNCITLQHGERFRHPCPENLM